MERDKEDKALPSSAPLALPQGPATHALRVAPKTGPEAARAVRAAKERGLDQLWVEVPLEGETGKDLLAAAIATGKESRLAVVAAVRLLQRPGGEAAPQEQDLNILGQTGAAYAASRAGSPVVQADAIGRSSHAAGGDWLRPDLPSVAARLKQRLVDLAATPGLSGLVVTHTAAPGYDLPLDVRFVIWASGPDYGHTPEMRLRFLRQAGYDPIDLPLGSTPVGSVFVRLPFFPDANRLSYDPRAGGKDPLRTWIGFRYEVGKRLLSELQAALRAARPNLPLLLAERFDAVATVPKWYGSWEPGRPLPRRAISEAASEVARRSSRRILLNLPDRNPYEAVAPAQDAEAYARSIRTVLEQDKGDWDGFVLDLSGVPVGKALPLLSAITPAPSRAKAARAAQRR